MDVLKKELEEELKLSTEDLKSHAWYHGPLGREVHNIILITVFIYIYLIAHMPPAYFVLFDKLEEGSRCRVIHASNPLSCCQAAEALLERDGDFLVRDSSSAPTDYVLTCFWMNGPMHFKIIRVVLRPKMVRPCYRCKLVSRLRSSRTEVLPK